jgi:hypothetical protein
MGERQCNVLNSDRWLCGYVMAAVPCYPGWDSGRLGWGLRFPVRPGNREIHAEQESGETPTEYWRVRGGRGNNPGSQPYRRGAGSYEPATWGGGSGVQPVGGPRLDDLRSHGVSYAQHDCASVAEPIETRGRAMDTNRRGDGRRLLVGSRAVSVAMIRTSIFVGRPGFWSLVSRQADKRVRRREGTM